MRTFVLSTQTFISRFFASCLFLALYTGVFAQSEPTLVKDTVVYFDPVTFTETMTVTLTEVFQEVDRLPVFGACTDLIGEELEKCSFYNLVQYISAHLRYPEMAKKDGVEGTVLVRFIVHSKGEVGNIFITEGVSPDCDKEVKRLIQDMPAWQPGEVAGKPVNVVMVLPVKFKL
ncbi:MAG: energy transducer TonB [Saprospirales bacterium]|nr:energy transducer TonB [Saprospirales bacterium]MBK8492088.1 energy transducer TonB [Saprospirales bacterium]